MKLKRTIKKIFGICKKKEIIPIVQPIYSEEMFTGKVALVTGGTGGIGYAIAKALFECGCSVIVAGRNEKKLQEIKNEFNSERVEILRFDYDNIADFSSNFTEAKQKFGKIDIFVSSAGVHTSNANFWEITPEEYGRVLDINLKGTYFACQEVGIYMKENAIKGHILIISSTRGSEPAWSPYGISKWGLRGFTEGLAQLLFPYGITVNTIAPGITATSLVGLSENGDIYTSENKAERAIMPSEVANLATLLVSDAGKMIVGETIHISGGRGVFDIR